MSRIFFIILVGTWVAANPVPKGGIDTILERIRQKHDLPCLAAVVADEKEVLAAGAAGHDRDRPDRPIRTESRFHIGSVSKPVTATMIAALVEAGRLDWDRRVLDILPELREPAKPAYSGLTVRQLLSHTGGIAPFEEDEEFERAPRFTGPPREARYEFSRWLLSQEPIAPPGRENHYSNAGYAIVAAVAERIEDDSYENLVRKRVFDRLSLKSAGIGMPGNAGAGNPYPFADLIRPAGDLHMNLLDLASFGQVHLRGLLGHDGPLSAETIRELHTEVMDGYALGWNVREGYDFHIGGLEGMHTAILMIFPEDRRVFAVATNVELEDTAAFGETISGLRKNLASPRQGPVPE